MSMLTSFAYVFGALLPYFLFGLAGIACACLLLHIAETREYREAHNRRR